MRETMTDDNRGMGMSLAGMGMSLSSARRMLIEDWTRHCEQERIANSSPPKFSRTKEARDGIFRHMEAMAKSENRKKSAKVLTGLMIKHNKRCERAGEHHEKIDPDRLPRLHEKR